MRTLSSEKGTGGVVKSRAEDFIVREITSNGTILQTDTIYSASDLGETDKKEGKFTTFVLQKKNWDTIKALVLIAKIVHRGRKSIAYAGSKDRTSISVQLCSMYGVSPADLDRVKIKDLSINGSWKSDGVELGKNLGNSFTVSIRDTSNSDNLQPVLEELNGRMPNYFDKQRFGTRLNNAKVGMHLLNNDFEGAVLEFLTAHSENERPEVAESRQRLGMERDFKSALDYFPTALKAERSVIEYMSRYNNYANALRKLPRGLSIMFVHAVEALVFNMTLERRISNADFSSDIRCNVNFYGFPDIEKRGETGPFALANLVGYETSNLDEYEKEVLAQLGLKIESFKISGMPELSMKGSYRPLLVPFKGFKCEEKMESLDVSFSLPSGSYATILINEITKNDSLNLDDLHS